MVRPLSGGWVSNKCRNVLEYETQVSVLGLRISGQFEEVWVPRRTILALARKCRLIAHPQNPAVGLAVRGKIKQEQATTYQQPRG